MRLPRILKGSRGTSKKPFCKHKFQHLRRLADAVVQQGFGTSLCHGALLNSARQVCRRLKCLFEQYSSRLDTCSFSAKRAVWTMRRRPSCRHVVLFFRMPVGGCKCMQASTVPEDRTLARYMPSLDHELKVVVAVPFNLMHYQRLGTIQARARRFGW